MAEPAIPWYQSPVMKAHVVTAIMALVAIAPHAAAKLGLVNESDVSFYVEGAFAAASFVSLIYGGFKRAKSTIQPLTLTQASADTRNATTAKDAAQ